MNWKSFFGLAVAVGTALPASAGIIEIYPGDSFENAAENLHPGDTLIVHAGEYTHTSRIGISVHGTAQAPVVIRGAEGEVRPRIRLIASGHNTIDISGATWLTLRGLEITSPGIGGADGINLNGGPSHITIEDNVIHDVAVGINFRSSMDHIVARRNEIYDTKGTGEGMYIGCHDGSCTVRDSIIELNYIHHTNNADQGDGIEIKKNSHSNIVRDNVIHDTRYPCIILYGAGGNGRNIVERNVVWSCADAGLQVAADALVRNNLIFGNDGDGISSQSHNGVSPDNLQFVHNTIVGGNTCLRLNGWADKTNMVFANNAVYCAGANFSIGSLSGVTVSGNVFEATPPAFPPSGYVTGRSLAQDFIDAANRDVYPAVDSPLIGAGDAGHAAADDFNAATRAGAIDAGAYDWSGPTNPGWRVTAGFKDAPVSATVTLTADDGELDSGDATTLRWSTQDAVSCAAGGDWAGPRATGGSESVGPLAADATFTLTCATSAGQPTTASVTVTVASPPDPDPNPAPEPQPDPDPVPDPNPEPGDDQTQNANVATGSSSGSATGIVGLLLLGGVAASRRRNAEAAGHRLAT